MASNLTDGGGESEISKFPNTSRFFTTKNLPDLRTYQFTRDNKPIVFNGQSTGISYNPYNHPQSKTKANIPLDYYNLPTKISIIHDDSTTTTTTHNGPEIPSFELNVHQSKDPISFMESVADVGKQYGAVKLKLGEADHVNLIKSKIQINSDLFWFETNKLLNNPNQNELLNRLKFQHELIEFHCLYASDTGSTPPPKNANHNSGNDQQTATTPITIKKEFPSSNGVSPSINRLLNSPSPAILDSSTTSSSHTNDSETEAPTTPSSTTSIDAHTQPTPKRKPIPPFLLKLPMVDKRPLDVYKLFRSVIIRGGFSEVINKKLWAQIGRELGYKGKIMTSLSSSLKSSYQRILYPFEIYLRESKNALIKIEQHGVKRSAEDEKDDGEPPAKKANLDNDLPPAPLILGSAKEFKRSIKSKGSKGFIINSPHLVEVKPPNTFVIKSEDANNNSASTSKKNRKLADKIETPILPQTQLKKSLKYIIDNQANLEDKSRMKSNVNSSFYSLRQFMEKDLKFQEFIIDNNSDSFNNNSHQYHPRHNEGNGFNNNNSSTINSSTTSTSNNNGYTHDNDRKTIDIPKLEEIFLKFINNETKYNSLGDDDGLELECGVDIPNYINGSSFVQLGDDVSKYKSSLHNLTIVNSTNKMINSANNKTVIINDSYNHNFSTSTILPPQNSLITNSNDAAYFNSSEYISKVISSALFPWNLHNLPILPNSLFGSFTDADLNNNELVNSRLNIGMTFSMNNWTCEDHFTNLINYQFFGAVKRWYFIPESDFDKFEQLIIEINTKESTRLNINNNQNWQVDRLRQFFIDHPFIDYDNLVISLENMINPISDSRSNHVNNFYQSLIDGKTHKQPIKLNQEFFITPQLLTERGIRFTTTLQKPGEFIVKFPKTYSACVSYGFNLSEEVNFATKDWLDYALEAESWLSNQGIIPNFSTFKLLVNLIQIYDSGQNIGFSSEIYNKIRPMYDSLLETELDLRNKIRKLKIKEISIDEKQFLESDLIADDDLSNTFPTKVVVIEIKSKQILILSMDSFLQYQETNTFDAKSYNFELHLFYSDDKLRTFAKLLSNYSIDYQSWMKNYMDLMNENSDVSLKTYRSLLSEGERILSAIESTTSLNSGETDIPSENVNDEDDLDLFKRYIVNLQFFINKSNEFIEECQNLLSIKHQQRIRNGNEYRRSSGLTDLFALVDKVPNLNFSCAEIDQVLEFKNEIENFDKACRALLSKKNRPIQEFDDLINLGESFGIEIPSLTFITRIRDRLNWIKVYNLIQKGADPLADKKEVFTIDKLQQFFNQGLSILSKDDLTMIQDIESIVNQSVDFDLECGEFLKIDYVDSYDMDRLKTIAERFRTEKLFISMNNYVELSKLQFNAKMIAQYQQFNNNSDERFTYADAKQMHNSMNESGLKFNEVILGDEIGKTEQSVNKVWSEISQVRIITTLSKDVDLDHLNARMTLNTKLVEKLYQLLYKSEFALSEDDMYENSSSYVAKFLPEQDNESEATVKYYCLCREYEYGTMIECDKCNEWYHISCVGEQVSNSEDESYLCPLCKLIESKDNNDSFLANQLTLSRCIEYKNDFEKLKIYPANETKVVIEIIETILKHESLIRSKITELNSNEDVPIQQKSDKLKYYLRKIYGSGVFLNELFGEALQLVRVKEQEVSAWLSRQPVKEAIDEVANREKSESISEVEKHTDGPSVEPSASAIFEAIEQQQSITASSSAEQNQEPQEEMIEEPDHSKTDGHPSDHLEVAVIENSTSAMTGVAPVNEVAIEKISEDHVIPSTHKGEDVEVVKAVEQQSKETNTSSNGIHSGDDNVEVDKDEADKNKVDKDAVDNDEVDKDKADKDAVDKDAVDKDAVDKDAVDKDAVDKDAVDKDAVDKDAVDNDQFDKDVADKDDAVRSETHNAIRTTQQEQSNNHLNSESSNFPVEDANSSTIKPNGTLKLPDIVLPPGGDTEKDKVTSENVTLPVPSTAHTAS